MKTAIITGASTGIGRAVAIELAKLNYEVYLIARTESGLLQTQTEVRKNGGVAEVIVADLSSMDSINDLITALRTKAKRVDLIANIAGVWHGEHIAYAGTDLQRFEQKTVVETMTVGLTAPLLLVHGVAHLMPKGSKIINLSGTFENGAKGWVPYYVSKRGIEDLTIALSQEYPEFQVNCVSPSDTATESYAKFFPQYMPEAIDPIEIAKKFADLAVDSNTDTGKVFVMKKNEPILEKFH